MDSFMRITLAIALGWLIYRKVARRWPPKK